MSMGRHSSMELGGNEINIRKGKSLMQGALVEKKKTCRVSEVNGVQLVQTCGQQDFLIPKQRKCNIRHGMVFVRLESHPCKFGGIAGRLTFRSCFFS